MAGYFTIFCVFQVMCAASNVLAAPFNLTSGTPLQPQIMGNVINPEDPDAKHDKRSLNLWPFEPKYLSTQHYTLEIKDDGTVRASKRPRPLYGALRILTACVTMSTLRPPYDSSKVKRKFGRVSIKGERADKYLCMNSEGDVYASDNCTDECEFKQEGIEEGGNPHNRYYSLKYAGFPGNPKRRKKRWYIGMKRGKVLKGPETRKRKPEVHFIQRPVSETGGPASGYEHITNTTPINPTGEIDNGGKVSVITSPNVDNSKESRTTKGPRRRNCLDDDPLNLFRLASCSKEKRTRGNKRHSRPFSSDRHIRHGPKRGRKDSTEGSSSEQTEDRTPFNLFSIKKNNHPNR